MSSATADLDMDSTKPKRRGVMEWVLIGVLALGLLVGVIFLVIFLISKFEKKDDIATDWYQVSDGTTNPKKVSSSKAPNQHGVYYSKNGANDALVQWTGNTAAIKVTNGSMISVPPKYTVSFTGGNCEVTVPNNGDDLLVYSDGVIIDSINLNYTYISQKSPSITVNKKTYKVTVYKHQDMVTDANSFYTSEYAVFNSLSDYTFVTNGDVTSGGISVGYCNGGAVIGVKNLHSYYKSANFIPLIGTTKQGSTSAGQDVIGTVAYCFYQAIQLKNKPTGSKMYLLDESTVGGDDITCTTYGKGEGNASVNANLSGSPGVINDKTFIIPVNFSSSDWLETAATVQGTITKTNKVMKSTMSVAWSLHPGTVTANATPSDKPVTHCDFENLSRSSTAGGWTSTPANKVLFLA